MTNRLDDYARALAAYEGYLSRQRQGTAESQEEFLAAHMSLRDLLAPMLAVGEPLPPSALPPIESSNWRGLPDDGDDFGDYRIERCIGEGGMGAVYLAQHRELGRAVALKLILPERLYTSIARERFWREAKAAAKLDHPNICPVYEVGEVDGIPFMAMRLVAGRPLTDVIENAQTTESSDGVRSVLALFEKLARALHYAHGRGVVHRDIKPANVLIDADGEPVIVDFGLARDEDSVDATLTLSGQMLGTPLYMSPEQISPRERKLDRTTDVYSLGVTLYECLAGRRPFHGTSVQEVCQSILAGDPTRPSRFNRRVGRDLDVIVAKAIDKDRNRRYRTAEELADDLRRARMLEPIQARPAGALLRARRWTQRNPKIATFMAVLVVALTIITIQLQRLNRVLSDFDALGDTQLVNRYEQQAYESLLPLEPGADHDQAALHDWLTNAEALLARADDKRARIDALRARAESDGDEVRFGNPRDQLLYDSLVQLRTGLESFGAPTGIVAKVRLHIAWYRGLEAQTLRDSRGTWDTTIASIADAQQCPLYEGLRIEPQLGLIPLRRNQASGLWEFRAVQPGGEEPRWNEAGQLANPEDADPVMVLVPGGTFVMGSQNSEKSAPHYFKEAEGFEKPPHAVTLAPFFISKYELTQGQWRRWTRTNPSLFTPEYGAERKLPASLGHPVERVSWLHADRELRSWGLQLPTEAQWEYAARAGTSTTWWTGSEPDTLAPPRKNPSAFVPRVNYCEADAYAGGVAAQTYDTLRSDDWSMAAPVDALAPNPFGLHHILGNLWEWCRDPYQLYPGRGATRHRDGDGLLEPIDGEAIDPAKRTVRGGSYLSTPNWARSSMRIQRSWTTAEAETTIRPARVLQR